VDEHELTKMQKLSETVDHRPKRGQEANLFEMMRASERLFRDRSRRNSNPDMAQIPKSVFTTATQ